MARNQQPRGPEGHDGVAVVARTGRASADRLLPVKLESEHIAEDHLEQDRRGQLIAGEVLIDGKLRVRVNRHRMKVTFDSR